MTQSVTTRSKSSVEGQKHKTALATSGDTAKNSKSNSPPARVDNPDLTVPLATAWNEALCCEVRNSLQVILSGAEILVEDHLGNLLSGQKTLLAKMTDNAYHLTDLLAMLLGPEELQLVQTGEERFQAFRRGKDKV